MSPTTQAFLAALIGAVVAGGAVLAWQREPAAAVAGHPRPRSRSLPAGVATVLSRAAQQRGRRRRRRRGGQGLRAGPRARSGPEPAAGLDRARRARPAGTPRRPDPRGRPGAAAAATGRPARDRARRAARARGWCWPWSRTAPASAGSSPYAATSWPTCRHELKTPVGAIRLLAEAVGDASDDPEAVERFARPDAHRERPAPAAGAADHRALAAPGRRPARGARPSSTSTTSSRGRSTSRAIDADAQAASRSSPAARRGSRIFGNEEQVSAAVTNLVANAVTYSGERLDGRWSRPRPTTTWSRSRSSTRASASRTTSSTASSSGSTGSTRPGTGPPAAPASASRSSSTSPPPTAATYGCGRVEGQGSTFTLSLPRAARPRSAERMTDPDQQDATPMTRVLVVEDEESYATRCPTCSARRGSTSSLAADRPRRAGGVRPQRRRHRAARPDAARACPAPRCAARSGPSSSVPVIMVSAKDDEVDKIVGLELGADDYVTKPYSPARAGRPDPRRAPARHRARPGADDARGRLGPDGRRAARRDRRRRSRSGCRSRSSSCSRCSCATRAGCSPAVS